MSVVLGRSAPDSRAAPAEEPSPTYSEGGERARSDPAPKPGHPHQRKKEEMQKRLITTLVLATAVALISAPAALAAANDLNQVIDNLRIWITGLLAALATLLLMVGGVRYLLAAGDPGSHERAKGSIRAALIGYALALLAPVLVSIVQRIVGG